MTVSVVIYLGYRGGGGGIICYIKFVYLSLYLAEILFWLLLKHFFFHDGAASNQGLPATLAEKENQDIKHTNCKDVVSS